MLKIVHPVAGIEEEINYRIKGNIVGEKGAVTMEDIEDVSAWLTIAKQVDVVITQSPNETARHLWNLTKALAKCPYTEARTQVLYAHVQTEYRIVNVVTATIFIVWILRSPA